MHLWIYLYAVMYFLLEASVFPGFLLYLNKLTPKYDKGHSTHDKPMFENV